MAAVLISKLREVKHQLLIRKTIGKFKSEMKKLILNRDWVLKKVEAINKKTEIAKDSVLEWLNEVERVMEKKEKIEIEIGADINICFFNVTNKHRFYVHMTKNMQRLNEAALTFQQIAIPILDIEYINYGSLEWFKSTTEASEFLLDALQDDSSYMVGLHGMPGSGKTVLAKAVAQKARLLNIFGTVVFANVSRNSSVWGIQVQIADTLNLELAEISDHNRLYAVCRALQSRKRVLVILDDVGAKLELEDIGIPCSEQCKVLLTTRSQQVCTLMGCQKEIPLHPLSEDESWMLFKRYSGLDDDNSSSNLSNVAREVVVECKGIPQTIKEVASSLKRKPISEWKASLDCLKYPTAKYQVFLSFRGTDTRYSFTGFLYHALCREGLKTFMDDEGLESGNQISQTLIDAINTSRLSIVVFSENFAYSTWCLDELVTIVECMKKNNQLVWPIFYKVDPSDVRHQTNSYGAAMEVHKKRFGDDSEKVLKWRSALSEVCNLSGEHYKTGYEYEFIQRIVKKAENVKNRLCIQHMD